MRIPYNVDHAPDGVICGPGPAMADGRGKTSDAKSVSASVSSPGQKFDAGKSPVGQGVFEYFPRALLGVGLISAYGANKYSVPYADKNWTRVPDARNRYRDGEARHFVSEAVDGLYDPESGLLHALHKAWNALAEVELLLAQGTKAKQ